LSISDVVDVKMKEPMYVRSMRREVHSNA